MGTWHAVREAPECFQHTYKPSPPQPNATITSQHFQLRSTATRASHPKTAPSKAALGVSEAEQSRAVVAALHGRYAHSQRPQRGPDLATLASTVCS